jgi:hypothetical protein
MFEVGSFTIRVPFFCHKTLGLSLILFSLKLQNVELQFDWLKLGGQFSKQATLVKVGY